MRHDRTNMRLRRFIGLTPQPQPKATPPGVKRKRARKAQRAARRQNRGQR